MAESPVPKVRLHIRIVSLDGQRDEVELADPTATLGAVLTDLVQRYHLPATWNWVFLFRDTPVDPARTTGALLAEAGQPGNPLLLVLLPRGVLAVPPGGPLVAGEAARGLGPPPPVRSPAPLAPGAEGDEDTGGEVRSRARAKFKRASGKPTVTRRATVRYYSRMNPERVFPLLVVLSEQQVQEIVKKAVKQAESAGFQVEEGSAVEVEPVLPGCDCHPAKDFLPIRPGAPAQATFWVVPHVLGRVRGARVVVRQGPQLLAEVPLEIRVSRQTLAVACGLLSLAAPYLTMSLKSLRLDFESQQADGFPVYQAAGRWVLENLRPEWVGAGFVGLAVGLYFWMRPRKRDVFWDVGPKG